MIRGLVPAFALMLCAFAPQTPPPASTLSFEAQIVLDAWRAKFQAAKDTATAMPGSTLAAELERRIHVEQAGRMAIGDIQAAKLPIDQERLVMAKMGKELSAGDAANTEWLKSVIPADGWFRNSRDGRQVVGGAWLIVQHSPDRQLQKDVLAKMAPLVELGEVRGQDYALLYDRTEMAEDRPQRYGSQGTCVNGALTIDRLEDPEHVDELRAKVGLGPLEDYAKILGVGRRC